MKKYLKFLFFLLLPVVNISKLIGQNFNNLQLFPFSNILFTANNSSEIKPIRNLFQSYDLVLLAESTHYDGATLDAQCMIMKELIDSGEINTIYLESSWLNSEKIMSILLNEGKSGISRAKKYASSGEFINWIDNGFWNYLAEKIIEHKVRIVGFDIETNSWTLIHELFTEAKGRIVQDRSFDSLNMKSIEQCFFNFETLSETMHFKRTVYNDQMKFITRVRKMYSEKEDSLREYQWSLIEKYFYWIYNRQFLVKEDNYNVLYKDPANMNISLFNSIRDSIMAEIFLKDFLNKKNTKAIIKTSSYHALRNYESEIGIQNVFIADKVFTFNTILSKMLPNKIFSICFISSSGKWGLNFLGNKGGTKKIEISRYGIEAFFKERKEDFFFSSFKDSHGFDSNTEFVMKVVFQRNIKAKWAQIFSGFFFIREMYPVKYLYPDRHQFNNTEN